MTHQTSEVYRAVAETMPPIGIAAKSATRSSVLQDEGNQIIVTPSLISAARFINSHQHVQGTSISDAALQSLVNLVAIVLERTMAQEMVNRAEVARRSEELKSTLLDAMAHEFKTPLTSIRGPVHHKSSPQSVNGFPRCQRVVTIADEGADRLSKLVTDAIQLARIEGGKIGLNRGVHFPSSPISATSVR